MRVTAEEIISMIPIGRKNAITKSELVARTGLSERVIRKLIEEASGTAPVINLQDGRGYFQPSDEDLPCVEKFFKQETSRANSILKRVESLRVYINLHNPDTNIPKGKTKVHEHWRNLPKRTETEGQLSLF